MSVPEQSVILCVKNIDLPDKSIPEDEITCYLYLNSSPFSVSKMSNPNSSILIPARSPDDSLQLVFRRKDQIQPIGSVSFRMNYFAQANTNRFTRWITLFDDPVCDSFAGNIGEDKSRPRTLIDFEISKEEESSVRSESNSQLSFELYLKEKEQSGGLVLPQIKEELEISDLKDSLEKDSLDEQNFASVEPLTYESKVEAVQSKNTSEESSQLKVSITEENQSPQRAKQQGLVEALSAQDLNRNQSYRQSLESRKDGSNKSSHREEGEMSVFYLEQQNVSLTNKINELNQKIQELEVKNVSLKESEEASITKMHHLKIEVEKLRFKTENYETLVTETEQELVETKDQLTTELAAKTQILKDKEGLALSLQQTKEAYEELKVIAEENKAKIEQKESANEERIETASQQTEIAQANDQIRQHFEQLLEQRENAYNEETESLKTQNNQLREETQSLKAKIQEDEAFIQNLQKEIVSLKQKEEEAGTLNEKLKEAEDKVRFYEEKTKSMIEVCAAYLFKDMNQFESIEDLIIRVQKEINNNKQEMQDLRTINEALELKLSICDNKLLADTLWGQINDFKQQVSSLEKERESQKNELFKVNENYSKLINKYTELTEVLASLQQPVQKTQVQKTAQRATPTMGNLTKTIQSKLNTRTAAETPDELEAKLAEFTTVNKISPSFLTKVEKGVYLYNGRKINLKVINGKIMVKGVTGYRPLQDFIKGETGTRTPPRTNKEYPKTERKSMDTKSKKLELNHTQIADHLRRDLTPDSVRSMSFSTKEALKDFTPKDFDTRPLLTEPSQSETKVRSGMEQVKVKDLIASRSVERRISYNISRSGQKRESLF